MVASNLPVQLTSFIGREHDLAEVARLLTTSHLVTLIGTGGAGKTRLAIQVANTISDTFTDGIWLVDFAPLHEPSLVPQLVGQSVGLRPASNQPLLEILLEFVRPKRLLLIFDNCEHLNTAIVQLAQQLLSHTPRLKILATSREPLAVKGEMVHPVQGLGWSAFGAEMAYGRTISHPPQGLIAYDAIRLFVERARAISPHFTITAENATAVVEICRKLDGLPLAIELASARTNVLTAQQIVSRLDDRFALLTAGQRAGFAPRHSTLRAAIDWSYDLLTAVEQALFRRLAVFEASFTLDTAVVVCIGEGIAEKQTLDLLASLVDKSLVIAETNGRAQARYRLLETIREYALEKLTESGETTRLRDRHLHLFLVKAEESMPKQFEAYQRLWLNWLASEHDNLRAALAWALASGQIELGLRLANSLPRFWEIEGSVLEGLAWFDRLLAEADERVSLEVQVNALVFATFLAMFLRDAPAAMRYGREAVEFAEGISDENSPTRAFAMDGLASAATAVGDHQTAFKMTEQTIRFYRQAGPAFYLGMALLSQGGTAIELGDYAAARKFLDESLALARQDGDAFRMAHSLNLLGDLARLEQNYAEAVDAYESAVNLLRELGAGRDLASFLGNLGYAHLRLGDVERAYRLFSESMTIHQSQQNRPGMAEGLIGFAATAVMGGHPAGGVRLLAAAVVLNSQPFTSQASHPSPWKATQMEFYWYLALARNQLTEATFQAEQMAGQALSLEQAIQYAQNLPLKPAAAPPAREQQDGLTGREREVVTLIAQGKSNSEIAAELVLSKRTVEKHIANILSKLSFTSRAQIVRWGIENGLSHNSL